tara:strand:+ start:386 stop:616 length:231 start_codon:yes stop_codon:yes gene_type:complete
LKKLYTTEKYKKRNQRHAKRSSKRRLVFKEYQRQNNKSELGLNKTEKEKRVFKDPSKDYTKVHAPKVLSFIKILMK